MTKFLYIIAIILSASSVMAADVDMQRLDEAGRSEQPQSNSLMFRRNAEQYNMLTEEQKQEIAKRREIERQRLQEYERQKAEYERQKALYEKQMRAQQEAERKRAEALKPIKLYGNKLKIYALVNGEIITSSDMESRINAFILTTGIPYNEQTKAMITNRVLQSAIDEKLKIQEAKKNKIKVTKTEITKAVRDFEISNKMKAGDLQKVLAKSQVSMNVWIKQIEADLAWKKLISQKGYRYISVGESDIDRALQEFAKDMTTEKYMLSEIVVSKKDAKDINQLSEVLRHDPRFELYAMQFSQSPSKANGGKLGWIIKGKLPEQLEKNVLSLKEGGISNPILYGGDYYIFKMDKVFDPKRDAQNTPSRKQMRNFLENKKLEEYSVKYLKDLRTRALIEKKI